MQKIHIRSITVSAVIAAIYVALTLLSSLLGLSYGPIQLRLSEVLCVLPFLYAPSVWGVTVGCFLANLMSPYGPLDLVAGTFATFVAAKLTQKSPSPVLAPLPPVLCNAIITGGMLALEESGFSRAALALWGYHFLTIGLGELLLCYGVGLPLLRILRSRTAKDS